MEQFDLNKLTECIGNIAQNVDESQLEDLKNSIDREKIIKESTGLLDMLKGYLSPEDQQSLTNILDELLPNREKEQT